MWLGGGHRSSSGGGPTSFSPHYHEDPVVRATSPQRCLKQHIRSMICVTSPPSPPGRVREDERR